MTSRLYCGRSPRNERRATGGIATATSNVTMSLGNEIRPNLFPEMGRSRWGRLLMSGVFVYKGTLNVETTALPRSVNARQPSITQGPLMSINSSLVTCNPSSLVPRKTQVTPGVCYQRW